MFHQREIISELRNYIEFLQFMEFDKNQVSHHIHKLLPAPFHALIFTQGRKICRYDNSTDMPVEMPRCYFAFAARAKKYVLMSFPPGHLSLIITLKPNNLYKLFKIVPGNDEELFIDAEKVLGYEITEVLNKLGDKPDLTDLKVIIEDYLISKIPQTSQQTDILDKCIDEILKTKGCLKIEELASRCHVSKRTVERQFSSKLGTSPLHYSRIVRCNEVLKYLSNGNNHTSFDVVEHFNYYDQPHFIHDFSKFSGESPQLYLNNNHMLERILTID